MLSEDLQFELIAARERLVRAQWIGRIVHILTLGIVRNQASIERCAACCDQALKDLREYEETLQRIGRLKQEHATITLHGVSVSSCTFSDLPVVLPADYGIDWEQLREMVLSRDGHECQEADGNCDGPLQIHHHVPLSKGGTNDVDNLVTLCLRHHCFKHPHMRENSYGNLRG